MPPASDTANRGPATTAQPAPRPRIVLIPKGWEAYCKRHGLVTDKERADFLGVTRKCVNEFQNGHRGVGEQVIIAALTRFDGVRFEDIFEPRTGPAA